MWNLTLREKLLGATLVEGVPAATGVAAVRADPGAFGSPPGLRGRAAAAWRAALSDGALRARLAAELAALKGLGADYLTPECPTWPAGLPPNGVLRVRGALPVGPCVAVVGARRADPLGRELAGRVADAAARAAIPVVSGGAFGIDAAAHRGALEADGRTVVVLGSGLSHPTPRAHLRLFARAAEAGAVVSPFSCEVRPTRWTFPRRNVWMAGLSEGVVVVQAGARSGARYTAEAARRLGRPVWAAPGPVDCPLHQGCHRLIAEGSKILCAPDGWVSALRPDFQLGDFSGLASTGAVLQHPVPEIGEALWSAAASEPAPLEALAKVAGMSSGQAAAVATLLEIRGWLRPMPGGRYVRAVPRDWMDKRP